jgi:ubiquinone/menaquinone biosynthesis C-methylase UbiE
VPPNTNNLLDYYASIRASGLHARGQVATNKLLELLAAKAGDLLLEIGTGTGTTLVQTHVMYPQCVLHGLEVAPAMREATAQRLKTCGVSSIPLHADIHELPDHSFDVVYCESVLAIQEEDQLDRMVQQIKRVLKPGGRLVMNETIWLTTTDKEVIRSINEQCKRAFGMIQANEKHPYVHDWVALMQQHGLGAQLILKVDALPQQATANRWHPVLLKSKLFTWIGKFKQRYVHSYMRQQVAFQSAIQQLKTPTGKTMEGVLLVFAAKA